MSTTRTTREHGASRPRLTHPILAFVLSLLLISLAALPPLLFGMTGEAPQNLAELVVPLYSFAVVWLLLWVWVTKRERRPFTSIGLQTPGRGAARGLGLALVLMAVTLLPLVLLGRLGFGAGIGGVLGVVLMLGAFCVQGGAEEIAYRGFLMQAVNARWGAVAALLVQALAFTLPHLANPKVTPLGLFNIVLGGLMFGGIALWSRGLWAPIVTHAVWNWAQPAVFGFNVSGVPMTGYSLLEPRVDPTLGALWSGGEGGMESMITGVIAVGLVALVTLVLWWRGRRAGEFPDVPGSAAPKAEALAADPS